MASITHAPVTFSGNAVSDLLRSSSNGLSGVPLKSLGESRFSVKRREFAVTAKLRKVKKREYPWPSDPDPNVKGGILIHLSPFKPMKEKPKPVTLDFEKPLVALEKKINDVRKMAAETGLDFSEQITQLENKYHQALRDLYTHLTPIQRVNIARHPNRPTFLDHVFNITDKFVELHGDRAGYDDPAIVAGLGSIDGQKYMFIGQQKGRNTKESIKRNFGMPTPHGYRKALRMMNYADHHGFPIVTFIDTPGAFADLKSEELGQGESIAFNLRAMFGLKVPVISIVIGEGGSGGALAIGCANKLLMLENAVFYVASPEACAAILWKSAKASPMAAEKLKITATELCKLQIADGIIPEPLGGAHADPQWTSQQIKLKIVEMMDELKKMNTEELLKDRMLKFRKIGCGEDMPVPPELKKKQLDATKKKKALVGLTSDKQLTDNAEQLKQLKIKEQLYIKNKMLQHQTAEKKLEFQFKKLRDQILKSKQSSSSSTTEVSGFVPALNKTISNLKKWVDYEYAQAAKALGFDESLKDLRHEFSEAKSEDQDLQQAILSNVEKIKEEFEQNLSKAPNYERLQKKLDMLKYLSSVRTEGVEAVSGKQQVNEKFKEVLNRPEMVEKIESLKAEIAKSGAASAEDLDQELKEKIVRTKKEIEAELKNVIGLQVVKPEKELAGSVPFPEIETKIENVNEKISKKIEDVMSNSEIKDMVAALKEEVAKAGPNPDLATKKRISALGNEIRAKVSAAISSSVEKEELTEILKKGHGSGNGSVRGDENATTSEESRPEVSVSVSGFFS